ncbi:MAG: hypothetical protein ACRDKZ_08860 [Actinomycetota bacterium]
MHGRTFNVGCAEVHPSRRGEAITKNGGKTTFAGARELAGFDSNRLFLLMGGDGCGALQTIAWRDDLPDSQYERLRQPKGVEFTIDRRRLRPRENASVRLRASELYIFGVQARLGRLVGDKPLERRRWAPISWVVSSTDRKRLTTIPLHTDGVFPDIGFTGEVIWPWRVPQLRRGWYEIRKELIASEPAGDPVDDRTVVASVRFKIVK